MNRTRKRAIPVVGIFVLILTNGCDDQAAEIAREAADRQAEQNRTMAELNKQVADGARNLVEADAQARKEIVGVHRDLQAERSQLHTGWDDLEQERRNIAERRRRESLLVPVLQATGLIALIVVVLGFCWRAIVRIPQPCELDGALNELLLEQFMDDELPRLIAPPAQCSLTSRDEPSDISASH